jgi:hypothetical protein
VFPGMREHFAAHPEEAYEAKEGSTVQSTIRRTSEQVSPPSEPGGSEKNPFFEMEEVYYDAEEPQDAIVAKVVKVRRAQTLCRRSRATTWL